MKSLHVEECNFSLLDYLHTIHVKEFWSTLVQRIQRLQWRTWWNVPSWAETLQLILWCFNCLWFSRDFGGRCRCAIDSVPFWTPWSNYFLQSNWMKTTPIAAPACDNIFGKTLQSSQTRLQVSFGFIWKLGKSIAVQEAVLCKSNKTRPLIGSPFRSPKLGLSRRSARHLELESGQSQMACGTITKWHRMTSLWPK